jgi:hypothetical protein
MGFVFSIKDNEIFDATQALAPLVRAFWWKLTENLTEP